MGLNIVSPKNSFIQFAESDYLDSCGVNEIAVCLPVLNDDDIAFQFLIQADTEGEADLLCDLINAELTIGIRVKCTDNNIKTFTEKTERFRIGPTLILYNWSAGLPGFTSVITDGQCFHINISTTEYGITYNWCSNCLKRISDGCLTSVVDYTGDDNQFGFDYCGGGAVDQSAETCEPTIITFTNQATVSIPYTSFLQAKYGEIPTVAVWIRDETGDLVEMGVRISFDAIPPTTINIDCGGVSSGIIKIS